MFALAPGQTLNPGDEIRSPSGQYRFVMQGDGNLVLYNTADGGTSFWASNTPYAPGANATLQTDGNLVVSMPDGRVVWSSGTYNHPGAVLLAQDDGNVVVYGPDAAPLWSIRQDNYDRGHASLGDIASSVAGPIIDAVKAALPYIAIVAAVIPAVGPVLTVVGELASAGMAVVNSPAGQAALATYNALDAAGQQGFAIAAGIPSSYTQDQINAVRSALAPSAQAGFDQGVAATRRPAAPARAASSSLIQTQAVTIRAVRGEQTRVANAVTSVGTPTLTLADAHKVVTSAGTAAQAFADASARDAARGDPTAIGNLAVLSLAQRLQIQAEFVRKWFGDAAAAEILTGRHLGVTA